MNGITEFLADYKANGIRVSIDTGSVAKASAVILAAVLIGFIGIKLLKTKL